MILKEMTMWAPNSIGRCKAGLAKALSTMRRALASSATVAIARMSAMARVGLAGVSRKNIFVFGVTARRHASMSVPSTIVLVMPKRGRSSSIT
jgi:hypothetical protein